MSQKCKGNAYLFLFVVFVRVTSRDKQSAIHNAVSNYLPQSSLLDLTFSWQMYHHRADSQCYKGILNLTWMVHFENNGCHQPDCLAWEKQSRLNWPLCSGKCFVTQTSHCLLFSSTLGGTANAEELMLLARSRTYGRHTTLGIEYKRVELWVKSVSENILDQHTCNASCMNGTVPSARGATKVQTHPLLPKSSEFSQNYTM